MRKVITILLTIVMLMFALLPTAASADFELSPNALEEMNSATALVLNVNLNLAIDYKEDGKDGKAFAFPASSEPIDLMEFSIDRLEGIKSYLLEYTDFEGKDFAVDVITERPKDADRLQFLAYTSVQDILRKCGWRVTQPHNPEAIYDAKTGEVGILRLYLDYYADCDKEKAQAAVEEYTEALIGLLFTAYPDLTIKKLHFCWQIPAINKDSLYAATFFCEYGDDGMVLPAGSGLIY